MVTTKLESPNSHGMSEELLTSRFGSHESVCKPDQVDLAQGLGRVQPETSKLDQCWRCVYKVKETDAIDFSKAFDKVPIEHLRNLSFSVPFVLLNWCFNVRYTILQSRT